MMYRFARAFCISATVRDRLYQGALTCDVSSYCPDFSLHRVCQYSTECARFRFEPRPSTVFTIALSGVGGGSSSLRGTSRKRLAVATGFVWWLAQRRSQGHGQFGIYADFLRVVACGSSSRPKAGLAFVAARATASGSSSSSAERSCVPTRQRVFSTGDGAELVSVRLEFALPCIDLPSDCHSKLFEDVRWDIVDSLA